MKILLRVILIVLVLHISAALLAALGNSRLSGDRYAAILISDYAISPNDYWASPLACAGTYPYWTHYFNQRGLRTRWVLRAHSTDLASAVRDPHVESIVLVGHGSFNSWQAVDKLVTNDEVAEWMKGLPQKKGEWLQLTCAVPGGWAIKMGELVMEKQQVYTYGERASNLDFITDALSGFKRLKSVHMGQVR